jgi:regulatory protein
MKITRIEKQIKFKNRYNIFLDGEFAFGLYDDTILKFGLRTNDELSDEIIRSDQESTMNSITANSLLIHSFPINRGAKVKSLKN